MWTSGWRERIWAILDKRWDIIIIGGGITGAGILLEAARADLDVLLVDGHDFASGTSSRSSKMIHGGLRYLRNGQIKLTYDSVRERERLLREVPGLVDPMDFLMVNYRRDSIPGWVFGVGLLFYDLLAHKWIHHHNSPNELIKLCPQLSTQGLYGGYQYLDAKADDARLVIRIIQEAVHNGGMAINYARVTDLLRSKNRRLYGVVLQDTSTTLNKLPSIEVNAKVVINAAGAWADDFHQMSTKTPSIRKLCGSHLFFPHNRLPLNRAISALHPWDGRPVFSFPWEGVTLLGTTDIDYQGPLQTNPSITEYEIDYLLEFVKKLFPSQELCVGDVLSTLSGIRPVIDTGKKNPSKESREHILWYEDGLLTITGGKLTTFRLMAYEALNRIKHQFPQLSSSHKKHPILSPENNNLLADDLENLPIDMQIRLRGRYGRNAPSIVKYAEANEVKRIPGTSTLWAELRHSARFEGVIHLDDLLLRRTRLGNTVQNGALQYIDKIRTIVQPELGWSDSKWVEEVQHYEKLWNSSYFVTSRN